MKLQFQSVVVLAILLIAYVNQVSALNCYYCYLTSGCGSSFSTSNSDVYRVTCYSNATSCAKVVTSGGSTARGCSTSCTPSSSTSGTVDCCYADYCNGSGHYKATLPVILAFAVGSLWVKTRFIS